MPTIFIPALLRDLSGGIEEINVEGTTVRELIDALESRWPGVRDRLCATDAQGTLTLRPGLTVAVDGKLTSKGLRAKTSTHCEVHFLPAIGGG